MRDFTQYCSQERFTLIGSKMKTLKLVKMGLQAFDVFLQIEVEERLMK